MVEIGTAWSKCNISNLMTLQLSVSWENSDLHMAMTGTKNIKSYLVLPSHPLKINAFDYSRLWFGSEFACSVKLF